MGKASYKKLTGSQNLRQRLVLAALASTPVHIEDIRAEETWLGLRPHEVSFLRLLEKVSDDCVVEINETGTELKFKPGIVMGGRNFVHDCALSRAVGYFLEPLIVLGLFAKRPLTITLKGITNDSKDPSVDTFRSTTLPMLKQFGVPSEGLDLKIQSRGSASPGGGEVFLSIPIVQSLTAVNWTDEGMVMRIRGVTFSTRVSTQLENTMVYAARGIFNLLLPNVHIFIDHRSGPQAGQNRIGGFKDAGSLFQRKEVARSFDFVPDGYFGFILGEKNLGKRNLSDNSDGSSKSNCWDMNAKYKSITYWNHDSLPSQDDAFLRCFHWLSVAKSMHKSATAEDLVSASAALEKICRTHRISFPACSLY